ncbi:MAG: NADP-dependent phosphogluconate dehydrogenase [Ginsengibacter sp.]
MENVSYDFGMVGLGVMGSNLLLNMADNGFKVTGYDKDATKTLLLESSANKNTVVKGVNTLQEMIANLQKPRKIMMLVPAGKIVDGVIAELINIVEPGDIIIDGGNSHYIDTLARVTKLKERGIHFMGIGISGGDQGARLGPSIMPGGDEEAYKEIEPVLKAIAAKVNGQPCVAYLGNDAAGHYVKMIHNGIEYAIMELISECYDLMHNCLGLNNEELHQVFNNWSKSEMQSFLLEITADIFLKKDDKSDEMLIDMIFDRAGAKGTGKWTSQEGLDIPMPIPVIDMAVMMRNLSSLKEERIESANLYKPELKKTDVNKDEFLSQLYDALFFGTIISYAQGLAMLSKASIILNMKVPMQDVINVWTGGCIIRSALLPVFSRAYTKTPDLKNLLLNDEVASLIKSKLEGLRNTVIQAAIHGYPASGLMAALNYFNGYSRNRLPVNLIQAQRDYFGAHTYERTDGPGIFHTEWKQMDILV